MRVRLTLDGHKNDVLACVGIALENGILDNMETVNKQDEPFEEMPELVSRGRPMSPKRRPTPGSQVGKQFKPREVYARPFQNPGTRVVAKTFHGRSRDIQAELGVNIGDVGTIVSHKLKGNGVKVEVKWDRTGETSWINGSYLEVVRKVPVADRR